MVQLIILTSLQKPWNGSADSISLGSTSARKPNLPIFTPMIGVPLAPTRLIQSGPGHSSYPDPAINMNLSCFRKPYLTVNQYSIRDIRIISAVFFDRTGYHIRHIPGGIFLLHYP